MYLSTSITLDADSGISDGLATVHDDGRVTGHVTVYMQTGVAVTISSDDPVVLSDLADELDRAANRATETAIRQYTATAGGAA